MGQIKLHETGLAAREERNLSKHTVGLGGEVVSKHEKKETMGSYEAKYKHLV